MIGVEELTRIIKATLATASLKGERPLSLLIVADVGLGKSQMLQKFCLVDSVYYSTDTTPYTIIKKYGLELRSGKIKHIIIPEFLTILNKPREQADSFVTFFNSLIEEGVLRVESRGEKTFSAAYPVTVGLITAIAAPEYNRRRSQWASVGFLSRMLHVRFRYSVETADKILDSILLKEYHSEAPEKITRSPDADVLIPVAIGRYLKALALKLKDSEDKLAARKLKQLQTLIMGLAIINHRTAVSNEDLNDLLKMSRFLKPPSIMRLKDRFGKDIIVENTESYAEV